MGILSGYCVIDCSIAMAGPLATQRLGDLGADVIKVEPLKGEWQRHTSAGNAEGNRINVSFLSLNRNKRSLSIDLKSEEGRQALYKLVEKADVFLQNYRPGVAKRLGVDYESLAKINPKLVYLSISGYGESGPYATLPGQDLLLQAMSGAMMSAGRETDPPNPAGQFLVDAVTAAAASEAAVGALLHKERTGEGQKVEINMLDVITTLQMQELSVFSVAGKAQTRSAEPHAHSYIRAPYGVFETSDHYLALAFASLESLAIIMDEPRLKGFDDNDQNWGNRDKIFSILRGHFTNRTTKEWLEVMRAEGIWCGPVYGYAELIKDPQIIHNKTFVEYEHESEGLIKTPGFPVHFTKSPASVERGAPFNGQHSEEILKFAGYSADEITKLVASGIVKQD